MFVKQRKFIWLLSAAIIFTSQFTLATVFAAAPIKNSSSDSTLSRDHMYENYSKKFKDAPTPSKEIIIPAETFSSKENADLQILNNFEGRNKVLKWSNYEGSVEWNMEIPETGMYWISMSYYPIAGKGRDIELGMEIDGQLPFSEAQTFQFTRVWKDASEIKRDNRGNEYSPVQVEAPVWREAYFKDAEGRYNEPFQFYLAKGKHALRLICIREAFVIDQIRVSPVKEAVTYQEIAKNYTSQGYRDTQGKLVKVQAENAFLKSNPILHPVYDRSSPLTEPCDPSKIRLNTIGQQNWKYPNQWITWKIDVPEDGLYQIAFKFRQNIIRGLFTTRKLSIDGIVPFKEAGEIEFPYDNKWSMKVLGNQEPYKVYLKKGTHLLTLESVLGEMAQTMRILEESVFQLNEMYRKIIMITSTKPDPFRDYYLEKEIPDLIPAFTKTTEALSQESKRLEKQTGYKGSEGVLLDRVSDQLRSFIDRPDTIADRLDNYKSNISSLSAWILRIKEQPLELDYIIVSSPGMKLPRAEANIFEKAKHEVSSFISSFFEDYSSIGNVFDKKQSVTVWIESGRDQAQIIKNIVDEMFTPKTGIAVNLKLVEGALMQAVLAGKGPDIALHVGRSQPVNLAIRGSLVNLKEFSDFQEVTKRYMNTAMVPYTFEGGYYALPDSQTYNMLFYRKDIFNELGIRPPETWEDFHKIVPVIQRNNMTIGIPGGGTSTGGNAGIGMQEEIFSAFLYQRGGKFYSEDGKSVALDEPEALEAFQEWTGLYTHYDFPLVFDFYNRFRTGEMPMGIQAYTQYNMLSVAAPEIRNLWEMIPIPGTRKSNGEIDRRQAATGNASVMFKSTRNKEAAWEFLKWWTSSEVQMRYSRDLEAIMGVAARYNTANMDAFEKLPWNKNEYDNLMKAWKQVQEVPELPGSYYMSRNLDNAFKTVVYNWENPREILFKWNKETNKEIVRKRFEFGLN